MKKSTNHLTKQLRCLGFVVQPLRGSWLGLTPLANHLIHHPDKPNGTNLVLT